MSYSFFRSYSAFFLWKRMVKEKVKESWRILSPKTRIDKGMWRGEGVLRKNSMGGRRTMCFHQSAKQANVNYWELNLYIAIKTWWFNFSVFCQYKITDYYFSSGHDPLCLIKVSTFTSSHPNRYPHIESRISLITRFDITGSRTFVQAVQKTTWQFLLFKENEFDTVKRRSHYNLYIKTMQIYQI